MEKAFKCFLLLFLLMSMAETNDDVENIIKEMRIEMNERLTLTEEKLQMTQNELLKTKDELFMTRNELLMTQEGVINAKEQMKEQIKMAEDNQKARDVNIRDLERDVSFLKDPPWTFACGAQYYAFDTNTQTISYTTLLYSSTNVAGAGLDISTGVFTAGHPGSYTATWNLMADNDAGEHIVDIYLRMNRKIIAESRYTSVYTGPSGYATDQGGRTLVLHLDRGDTLDLYCEDCSAGIRDTTFCVTLSQADVE